MMTDSATPRSYAAQLTWLWNELNHTRPQAEARAHMLRSLIGTVEEARAACVEREFELRMLAAAHCPSCDNSGTTRHGDECEWCFHRKRAVAALPSEMPGVFNDGGQR